MGYRIIIQFFCFIQPLFIKSSLIQFDKRWNSKRIIIEEAMNGSFVIFMRIISFESVIVSFAKKLAF
jgi:hypothetical protein